MKGAEKIKKERGCRKRAEPTQEEKKKRPSMHSTYKKREKK